jgi:hypothetical protein
MKKLSKIYYVLTYLFFIYPPFIAGLVLVYRDSFTNLHLYGLVVNIILLLILASIIAIRVYTGKLHYPTEKEVKYLIFGFVGNIVMFLYTFQNSMNIDNIITIYLILLVVLAVHYFLISKKLQPLELWIFLPLYLVFDTIYYGVKGCTFNSRNSCFTYTSYEPFLKTFFIIIMIFIVLFTLYKILSYRQHTIFKYINYVIVIVLSGFALNQFDGEIKIIMTFAIFLPFFIIVDFVVSIINKTYTHKTILLYIRTSLIIVICMLFGALLLGEPELDNEALSMFVVATYVALAISILKFILKIEVKDVNLINLFKKGETVVKYSVCTKEDIKKMESTFTNYLNKMTFGENEYNLKVTRGGEVLGLLHSDYDQLDPSLDIKQARIYFIEVAENPYVVANGLLYQVERYYKSLGVSQVKYLAHIEELEVIELLMKRGYIPVDIKDKGYYYFIKTL